LVYSVLSSSIFNTGIRFNDWLIIKRCEKFGYLCGKQYLWGMKTIGNVLSLFDGISCGQIALHRAGIKFDNYYASEIDKHAIKVTQRNYPNTIQLGDVTKVKIKILCLSEVYSYICNYDNNLQSNISEWEVLYWLNKNFTFSAKIGTQKPNERQEVSEPSTIQRIKEVWFSNREMGSVRKFGDYTRSRSNGEENDIRTPQQLQCGKWWYDNDIYRRYKEENIGITIGKTKNGDSEKKNFGNIEGEVFKRKESESCFRENEKSNVEKRCSGELFERKREDRFSREVEKEKRNRRTKEGNFIDEVIRELCRWDESDGITQDYWSLLRLHKEEQITVVEYEEGFYMFKGRIDLCIGGSPCQGFSFAGKGLNFNDPRSKLFFEFVRLKNELSPKYWMLENVKMKKEHQDIISEYLGIKPIIINSSLVSAQNRVRYYWTNIPIKELPNDKHILLKDIIEDGLQGLGLAQRGRYDENGTVVQHYELNKTEKSNTLTSVSKDSLVFIPVDKHSSNMGLVCLGGVMRKTNKLWLDNGKFLQRNFPQGNRCYSSHGKSTTLNANSGGIGGKTGLYEIEGVIRKLTRLECERLQTVPEGYTAPISDTQAIKALGNGWTVDVIAHIFNFIPND
jgi:site-specific DNA-cytosine methylase